MAALGEIMLPVGIQVAGVWHHVGTIGLPVGLSAPVPNEDGIAQVTLLPSQSDADFAAQVQALLKHPSTKVRIAAAASEVGSVESVANQIATHYPTS